MELNKMTWQETKERIKDLQREVMFFEDEIQDCVRAIEAKTADLKARMKNKLEVLEEIGRLEEELIGKQTVC
jgi:phage host-nuclease inhibitor protein Gam